MTALDAADIVISAQGQPAGRKGTPRVPREVPRDAVAPRRRSEPAADCVGPGVSAPPAGTAWSESVGAEKGVSR